MKIPLFKKKKKIVKIWIFFQYWEKGHLNSIRNGAEFRPLRTHKKSLHTQVWMLMKNQTKSKTPSLTGYLSMGGVYPRHLLYLISTKILCASPIYFILSSEKQIKVISITSEMIDHVD